jgi:hypothetical protein
MKILYFDIECTPVLGWMWGAYEQNLLNKHEDWRLLGFSYAWNEAKPKAVYPENWDQWSYDPPGPSRIRNSLERDMVEQAWHLFDEADVIVAHHGDRFDIPKMNAKFVQYGLGMPAPSLSIDTKKIASRHFKFTRNNLGELGQDLGLGDKDHIPMMDLQFDIIFGRNGKKPWDTMRKYNLRDIELLRDVFNVLRPATKLPVNHHEGCVHCGSVNYQKRGVRRMRSGMTYQQYQCNDCGTYFRAAKRLDSPEFRP